MIMETRIQKLPKKFQNILKKYQKFAKIGPKLHKNCQKFSKFEKCQNLLKMTLPPRKVWNDAT